MDQTFQPKESNRSPAGAQQRFGWGIDDIVIIPLAAMAFVTWRALRRVLIILIDIIDFLFPILLQVMRFPLFTLRIVGDGLAVLLKGVVRFLPVGNIRRSAWREFVSRHWAWLRQKISYRAFEEAVHHAFENGMAWVFRTCKTLSPRAALLVLIGAVLWFPISFAVATLMHAVLFAKALTLPAWMQLLHPVATIIAKSKLLVLPVYPAAWPPAKQHPVVQALIRWWNWVVAHYFVRKAGYRYRQIESMAAALAERWRGSAAGGGLRRSGNTMLDGINKALAAAVQAIRTGMDRLVDILIKVPLLGRIVQHYSAHYDRVNREPAEKLSQKMRGFVERWSVKFTAEYYETKAQQDAAKIAGGA
jgi:hypothetical protein